MKTVFIDSNIWIYMHVNANEDGKHAKAISLLENEILHSKIICSVQVINEFHWILERKYKIDRKLITKKVQSIQKVASIVPLTVNTYEKAVNLRRNYDLSFWDSLIVASAVENDADIVFSEDMRDGLVVQKKLKILNPL